MLQAIQGVTKRVAAAQQRRDGHHSFGIKIAQTWWPFVFNYRTVCSVCRLIGNPILDKQARTPPRPSAHDLRNPAAAIRGDKCLSGRL
jgi:hypothetical protein